MDRQLDTGKSTSVLEGFQKLRWFHISDATYMKYLFIAWMTILVFNPGKIEGQLFPVVAPIEITKLDEATDGMSIVYGKSDKLRDNCSFRYVRWYLGDRGHIDDPATVNTGPAIIRTQGPFEFGPWLIGISAKEFLHNSYGDAYYRCKYWFGDSPWLTKTYIFN